MNLLLKHQKDVQEDVQRRNTKDEADDLKYYDIK